MHHLVTLAGYSLGYLTFVVREHQIHASTMNIEMVAQILSSHSSTFTMPSRESLTPRAGPVHDMFGLCFFPQSKVCLILLFANSGQLTAGILDVVQRTSGKNTVTILFIELFHIKIHAAVTFVGESVVEYLLNQLLLFDNMSRCMRFYTGGQTIQRRHGFMEAVGIILSHLHGLQLFQASFLCDFVLTLIRIMFQVAHICYIPHITYFVANMLQITEQEVKSNGRTRMSQMCISINSRTTYVHSHTSFVQGAEKFFLPT